MNLKKLFSFQDGLTSFTYPVVKIVISLALLISAMLCARVADISNPLANLAFKVLYCVVAMACILCLIVSIHEFFSVISNRKTAHASPQDGKALTIQAVIDLTSRYDIIDIEAERLYTLIQDILLLAEIEAGNDYNIEECDVNSIVSESLELLRRKAQEKKLALIFEPEPYVKPFSCNPDRMKQLLINLVDNAVKNTEKGSVTVRCRCINNHLMISVKDTGIGIPKEHLSRIFERFYRVDKGRSRKMGGTGLGLSIVKHIVEMYNGDIFIDSEVNEGTEFIIKLPYAREQEHKT